MRIDLDARGGPKRSAESVDLEVGPGGEVVVSGPNGVALTATVLDDPASDPEIACWAAGTCVVAVGLDSHQVAWFDLVTWTVRVFGGLERIDLSGYDPGGMSRVNFYPVSSEVLLETEIGLAMLTANGMVWRHVHGDLTCRVVELDADRVVLKDEYGSTALRLRDGTEMLDGEIP